MAVELAAAYLSILPETSKIAPGIRQALTGGDKQADRAGRTMGGRFKSGFSRVVGASGGLAASAGIAGIGIAAVAVGKKSFDAFKGFDKTMRQVGAITDESGKSLSSLSDLALKLGKDTSFSASDASDAMLELAKGGMTAAQIKAGALKETLTLAAAGGLGLGDAATYMSNELNAFGLKATDAGKVAAALAGGANASTASVQSLGQALSQVGPGATNAGLSLNDTVGVLAAFDQAGIKGSDAGTSLKTMLTRLVPQTNKARDAMAELGLKFTDAHGAFLPITQIAQQLHDKLSGLSEEQKTTALSTIFGSDATRAATVLTREGSKGLAKYIKATKDKGAAEKLAKTNTSGAAGAMEQLSGSVETLEITMGKALAPIILKVVKGLTKLFGGAIGVAPAAVKKVVDVFGDLRKGAGDVLGWLSKTLGGKAGIVGSLKDIGSIIGQVAGQFKAAFQGGGSSGLFSLKDVLGGVLQLLQQILSFVAGHVKLVESFVGAFLVFKAATATMRAYKTVVAAVKAAQLGYAAATYGVAAASYAQGRAGKIGLAVSKAQTIATKAGTIAQKVFAVATRAVGLAMKSSLGPIGIIITVIALLVAGIIYAYKHSETFRKIVQATWHGIQAAASFAWNKILKPVFQAFAQRIRNTWRDFQTFGRIVGQIWNGVKSGISAGWNHGIKPVFQAVANFITKTVPRAFRSGVSAITQIWNKIKSAAKKPVNFIINTVYMHGIRALWNKISGAVGLKLQLPAVSLLAAGGAVPASQAGWRNRPTAIVGEGSSSHPEVVIPTDPRHRKRALALWSQAGGRLMDSGGWLDAIKVRLGLGVRNAASRQFGADPVELLTKAFDKIRGKLSDVGGGSFGTMMAELPKKLMSTLIGKAKTSLFSTGDIGGSGVQRWAPLVRRALSIIGLPVTDYLVGITLRRMNQESGGNPRAINNYDINAQRGDPSRGLMQTIGSTFRAYHFPGTSWNIYDPLANILASMRYALSRYGSLGSAYNRAGGYATGGNFGAGEWATVGERGPELVRFGAAGHVYSNAQSNRMAGPVVLEINGSNTSGLDRVFLSWLQGAIRQNPGVKLKVA